MDPIPEPIAALTGLLSMLRLGLFFEVAAIFISGLAGAVAGIRKGFDMFGVIVLAWTASLFGGVLRDVMIGSIPPVGISDWRYLIAAVGGGVAAICLYPVLAKWHKAIVILDAFALGLFVWIGTIKGLEYGMGPLASAMVGVLTGVGGGVVRDLFTDNVPLVLSDRQFYAIPACVGAAVTVWFSYLGWVNDVASFVVVGAIVAFRLIALKLHWAVPAPDAKI